MRRAIWMTGLALALVAGCGGTNGTSCHVTSEADGSAIITCDDGTTATVRAPTDGTDGVDGVDGTDGTTCTVEDTGTERVIRCSDGTMATVRDGTDGSTGRNVFLTGPGLEIEVRAQGIDADRHPFMELRFTDAAERPLDREGIYTEGAVSTSFTVAHLPTETRMGTEAVLPYVPYLTRTVMSADGTRSGEQPTTDTTGTWTEVDAVDGVYRYVFAATLPDGYPATETHRIAFYATRTFDGVRYVENQTATFRPDGMPVTVTRDTVTSEACATCHSPLSAHGGAREDTGLCVTCHARGMTDPDTGNTIAFEVMVHRIHRGADLPSVVGGTPYQIIGFRGSVHDYSTVELPQDIRNCQTCHAGPDGDLWNTEPSRSACGSCHDDIWFEAGAPPTGMVAHPGGEQADDTGCTVCHGATSGLAPVISSHFTKFQATDAIDLQFAIESVTIAGTGEPEITFTVTEGGAGRDIITTPLTRFSTTVAGPTTDYAFAASFNMLTTGTVTAVDAAAGRFTYRLPDTVATIAAAQGIVAEGTWAIGLEGYATTTGGVRYNGGNPVAYLAITDTTAVPRRTVVEVERCNGCHERIEMHGGTRSDPEYCVLCHNPRADTRGRIPAPAAGTTVLTESISFAHLVHRVHTGEEAEMPFRMWTPGGAPVSFDELRFPADRRACERCHVDGSTELPLDEGLLAARRRTIDSTRTAVDEEFIGPTQWACTGCHDAPAVFAHAETMTTALGAEACAVCHGDGEAFGVAEVHARPEYEFR